MNTNKKWSLSGFVLLAWAMTLAGCGGGGGSGSSTQVAKATAEGIYGGTLTGSASNYFQLAVLENGEFWAMYGMRTANVFGVAGFIQGSGTSNDGTFTAADTKDFGFNPAVASPINATYNAAAKTIAGTVSAPNGPVTFTGGPIVGSSYDYNAPAILAAISGSWATATTIGESVAINIAATGTFSAVSNNGCNFSGIVTPRPSGKNVFTVSLTFGAAPCGLLGQSSTGIAIAYPLNSGQTQLLISVVDSTRTRGTVVLGVR